ncbi:hypothetical protein SAY87_025438 [Trapa incisa]|uniref:Uncharacterized protein n=1 Tax=Trapa incisa TaxID=236973 RepID=A0AAN7JGI9_9MYRT|nr:hypothetical protein SAY87_025438 [Trapa incisa]
MPANNRVHSSAALQIHDIWQSAIGYDPYAPTMDDSKSSQQNKSAITEPELTEFSWLNDFSGVMRNVYVPVTSTKTI